MQMSKAHSLAGCGCFEADATLLRVWFRRGFELGTGQDVNVQVRRLQVQRDIWTRRKALSRVSRCGTEALVVQTRAPDGPRLTSHHQRWRDILAGDPPFLLSGAAHLGSGAFAFVNSINRKHRLPSVTIIL